MYATEQGGGIHPINFDLYAYERDAAHEVKEAAKESREAYLEYKEEQQEVRDAIAEAERLENMAWYEKAWEYGSTFVGWAGRAFKGGKAIHSTYKVMKATDSALNAYQTGRTLDNLRKAEYGLYGITSANGLGEYATGRDIFGNELSEEQREQSLNEAFALLGGNVVSVGLRKASPTVNLGQENKSHSVKNTSNIANVRKKQQEVIKSVESGEVTLKTNK